MTTETIIDVAVVGGGFAGLTVATRAAEAGLAVAVLEAGTEALYMCNSRVSTGAVHICFSRPDAPADDLYRLIMETSGGTARADLARALADGAAATLDWLRAHGADFAPHPRRLMGSPMLLPHRRMTAGLDWEESGPNLFLQALEAGLPAGTVRRGCRVAAILTEGDGTGRRVSGVELADGSRLAARAVAVCDGGFQADPDLVARHIGAAPGTLQRRNTGTGRGDGLRMATAIGAATVGLERFYGHLLSRDAMTNEGLWPYPQLDVAAAKGIVVTPDGRRFADEGLGGIFMANAIAALPDPLSATAVLDATVWEDARTTDNVPPNPALAEAGGTVIEAGSLAELAVRAGIDPDGLAATAAALDAAVRDGRTAALAPARTTADYPAHPLETPPFVALPLCAGLTVTSGGLAIDDAARVLDADDRPIPGLYAAGSTVGGIEGGPRAGYTGGLIKAFGIGLIAGTSIAAELG